MDQLARKRIDKNVIFCDYVLFHINLIIKLCYCFLQLAMWLNTPKRQKMMAENLKFETLSTDEY